MKWKPSTEEACLQSDCRPFAEGSYNELAEARKKSRVSNPIHNFEPTMTFGQVAKMPVIPSLQVAAVNDIEVDRSFKQEF